MLLRATKGVSLYIQLKPHTRLYLIPAGGIVVYLGWIIANDNSAGYHAYLLSSGGRGWLPGRWGPKALIDDRYFEKM